MAAGPKRGPEDKQCLSFLPDEGVDGNKEKSWAGRDFLQDSHMPETTQWPGVATGSGRGRDSQRALESSGTCKTIAQSGDPGMGSSTWSTRRGQQRSPFLVPASLLWTQSGWQSQGGVSPMCLQIRSRYTVVTKRQDVCGKRWGKKTGQAIPALLSWPQADGPRRHKGAEPAPALPQASSGREACWAQPPLALVASPSHTTSFPVSTVQPASSSLPALPGPRRTTALSCGSWASPTC